jgi:hypothetical protein
MTEYEADGATLKVLRLQAHALAELASRAQRLRILAGDLAGALRTAPLSAEYLRRVAAETNDEVDALARAARGYQDVRASDMEYPEILDDLRIHRWEARPDRELDGALPPIMDLRESRGYRSEWRRGGQTLALWFTAPGALAFAEASGRGRLHDTEEVREAIASRPPRPLGAE